MLGNSSTFQVGYQRRTNDLRRIGNRCKYVSFMYFDFGFSSLASRIGRNNMMYTLIEDLRIQQAVFSARKCTPSSDSWVEGVWNLYHYDETLCFSNPVPLCTHFRQLFCQCLFRITWKYEGAFLFVTCKSGISQYHPGDLLMCVCSYLVVLQMFTRYAYLHVRLATWLQPRSSTAMSVC